MNNNDIFKIVKWVQVKVNEIIPYASNRNPGKRLLHRLISLNASLMIYSKEIIIKDELKEQRDWHVNLAKEYERKRFIYDKIKINNRWYSFNSYLTYLIQHCRGSILRKYHYNDTRLSQLEILENFIAGSLSFNIGNCGINALLASFLLREYPLTGFPEEGLPPVPTHEFILFEDVGIKNIGDHCFIIINRKPDSNLNEPETWGDDAIICDPWDYETYFVKDALKTYNHQNSHRANDEPLEGLNGNIWKYIYDRKEGIYLRNNTDRISSNQPHSIYWQNKTKHSINRYKPALFYQYQPPPYYEENIPSLFQTLEKKRFFNNCFNFDSLNNDEKDTLLYAVENNYQRAVVLMINLMIRQDQYHDVILKLLGQKQRSENGYTKVFYYNNECLNAQYINFPFHLKLYNILKLNLSMIINVAIKKNEFKVIRNIVKETEALGNLILLKAIREWHFKIIRAIIDAGANIDQTDCDGNTALIEAVVEGKFKCVKLLIQSKASLNIQNNAGNNALMVAVMKGDLNIVKALIEAKADLNLQNKDGDTALILAFKKEQGEIYRLLFNAKAFINSNKKNSNHAPLRVAKRDSTVSV